MGLDTASQKVCRLSRWGLVGVVCIVVVLAAAVGLLVYYVAPPRETNPCECSIKPITVPAANPWEGLWYNGTFPAGFMWTSATSAYQIEGAWNVDGKGPSIWDTHSHTPGNVESNHTGDVACNSYYQYMDDIKLLQNIGVSHYRFSLSWTRIQPTGLEDTPNPKGIEYYNKVIDALLAANIQPMVTLYHWDLPQALEDHGGWLNESLVVPAFEKFSRIAYQAFGDRVKYWITHNEPWVIAWLGYGAGAFAPKVWGPGDKAYIAGHNLIKSHAKAYHVYDKEFRPTQKGEIGITLNTGWSEPRDRNNAGDVDASNRAMEFDLGWFANPIFVNGDYSDVMKFRVGEKSRLQNLPESRLPTFTEEEKTEILGTSDFFGLNHYSSGLVYTQNNEPSDPPSYENDKDIGGEIDPDWPKSGSGWLQVTPFGIRRLLDYINRKYGHPRILITENGVSDRTSAIQDEDRVYFYKHYINNVLQAIDLDDVNVIGYAAWSLLDNFEWNTGYNEKFGLIHVDFSDPGRARTMKDSARYYKQIIQDNGFPEAPEVLT